MPCSRASSGRGNASTRIERLVVDSTRAIAPAGKRSISDWWWRHQRTLTPLILLAPAVLMFATFVIVPIGQSLWLALYDWDGVGPKAWGGVGRFPGLFG